MKKFVFKLQIKQSLNPSVPLTTEEAKKAELKKKH